MGTGQSSGGQGLGGGAEGQSEGCRAVRTRCALTVGPRPRSSVQTHRAQHQGEPVQTQRGGAGERSGPSAAERLPWGQLGGCAGRGRAYAGNLCTFSILL